MNAQCETTADCLRELARVMDQFGINDIHTALNSKYVKSNQTRSAQKFITDFAYPEYFCFAIAEVEGEPVFIDDELFTEHGLKFKAGAMLDGYFCISTPAERGGGLLYKPENCSWNPPKPKTVIVEMRVEVAQLLSGNRPREQYLAIVYMNEVGEACKKALGNLK